MKTYRLSISADYLRRWCYEWPVESHEWWVGVRLMSRHCDVGLVNPNSPKLELGKAS